MYKDKSIVLGVLLSLKNKLELIESIKDRVKRGEKTSLFTPNPEIVLYADNNEKFKQILNTSTYNICDGFGLQIAAYILCSEVPSRITGVDLMNDLISTAAKNNLSIGLLGSEEKVINKTVDKILTKEPKCRIKYCSSGFSPNDFKLEKPDLINEINKCSPDILFVAFGSPKQEEWINYNHKRLNNVKFIMGVGGSFDFLSGNITRSPNFMRKLGLEWMYRWYKQPIYRTKRIINALCLFPFRVIKWKFRILFKYRKNIMVLILDHDNKILLAKNKRIKPTLWQLPQGE